LRFKTPKKLIIKTSTINPTNYTLLKLSANAHAETASSIGIDLNGATAFSIDAWVKLNGLCARASIFSKAGVFDFGIAGDTVFFQIHGYPAVQTTPNVSVLDDETWHHVCATYANGQVRLFIDGIFNVFQGISGIGATGTDPFLIGNGLQSLVKNVRVYNVQLDSDTVFLNMYNSPVASSVICWFDFSQNPPKETGSQGLAITLKDQAKMITVYPALKLIGTSYAKPLHDKMVNPGGYQLDSYTVQTWIYVTDTSVLEQMIFINDDLTLDSGMGLYLEYSSVSNGFHVKSQRGSIDIAADILTSTAVIQPNTWVNVGTTFDGTTLSIYINGELDTSATFGPIQNIQLVSTLVIGAAQSAGVPNGTSCFQGYISRVDVWETTLSPVEIAKYMAAAPETTTTGLQGLYSFDSSPARNLVNGHPIGLTDGAELDYQIGNALITSGDFESVTETNLGVNKKTICSIKEHIDWNEHKKSAYTFSEARKASLKDIENEFSGKELANLKEKINSNWDDVIYKYEHNPKEIPFIVTDHKIDGKYVMLCHTRLGSYVAYTADFHTISDCDLWKVKLLFVVVAGFLDAFFGLVAKMEQKVIDFIGTRVLVNGAINAQMAAGAVMTPLIAYNIGKTMYDQGLLKDLVKLMIDLGWWALFRMLAKLVLKFLGVGAANTIASLVATAALFIKTYGERPASCEPLPVVTIASIKFNYDTGSKGQDAINIRKNLATPVTIPEWQAGETLAADSPAAYAITETTGKTVQIQVKFNINTTAAKTVQLQATGGVF
jgi:hypothetical protein